MSESGRASVERRSRRCRPLPWPCSRLTPLERYDLRAMAEQVGVPATVFVRRAVRAYLSSEHARLYGADAGDPWAGGRGEPEPQPERRRVAEGGVSYGR